MRRITTRTGKKVKAPVFHTLSTKLQAVKRVNTLMAGGITPSKARRMVAKEVEVHPTTLSNWQDKHNLSLTQAEPRNNGSSEITDAFSINSLTVQTASGFIKLTPVDIKNIAGLAKLV